MTEFSIGVAASAGFRLIARKPLAVLAWGLAYFVLAALPVVLILLFAAPDLLAFIQAAQHAPAGQEPDMAGLSGLQMRLNLLQPVMFLASIVGRSVLYTAIFRAVLEPEKTGFFYMRLGSEELFQGLLQICISILLGLFIVAGVLVGAIFTGLVALATGAGRGGSVAPVIIIGVLLCLVLTGVTIWVCLRLSLAGPMTFADKTFRLFESWTLTKGHAWRLFGMSVLLVLFMFGVIIVLDVILGVSVIAGITQVDQAGLKAFFSRPLQDLIPVLAPVAFAVMAIGSILAAAFSAIFLAPWAEAYREIKGPAIAVF